MLFGMPNNMPGRRADEGGVDRRPVPTAVVREAAVLAHTVPGTELLLVTDRGELRVGRSPHHDLTPCELRQVVLAATDPGAPECFRSVRSVAVSGALRDIGGGMYELWPPDGSTVQRWFATSLHPGDIVELVEGCDLDVPDDAMDAGVATDAPLGISAVRVAASAPEHEGRLDEVSRWFLERCVVEELVQQVETDALA